MDETTVLEPPGRNPGTNAVRVSLWETVPECDGDFVCCCCCVVVDGGDFVVAVIVAVVVVGGGCRNNSRSCINLRAVR